MSNVAESQEKKRNVENTLTAWDVTINDHNWQITLGIRKALDETVRHQEFLNIEEVILLNNISLIKAQLKQLLERISACNEFSTLTKKQKAFVASHFVTKLN